jgi:hypothetical protein
MHVRQSNLRTAARTAALGLLLFAPPAERAEIPVPERPDLTGRIMDSAGQPLPGATIFIYTAKPRLVPGFLCPSWYADCRKSARSDANGEFRIESLDPALLFRLLVAAKGRQPVFVPDVDPFSGPVEVRLPPLNETDLGPEQALRGRIVNPEGEPLQAAVVRFEFFYGEEANCGGRCEGVDLIAVTDDEGEFLITSRKKFDWMTVSAEAPGYAKRKFHKLDSTRAHELKLAEGARVAGRLLKNGQPLPNAVLGLVSVNRSEMFTGDYQIGANEEGRFLFSNIPPYQEYYLYGLMDSLRPHGALPARKIRVLANGSIRELGDLEVAPGFRLSGHVRLSDGQPLQPGVKLIVSGQEAWDTSIIELSPKGDFALTNIPAGSYGVSARVPGYHLSGRNESLDQLNGGTLVGRIIEDTQLEILLDPGPWNRPDFRELREKLGPHGIQPYHRPLRGISPGL